MIVKDKEKFYKKLFILKYIPFIKYSTELDDEELKTIIEALNIKSRYKRIYYILDKAADYIDNYYSKCRLCDFKNNKCICHRNLNKEYINGCCRLCIYQEGKGCTTKNVACKLFMCTHAVIDKKRLELNDIKLTKLLNSYQRFILKSDYFSTLEQVTIDLYVGPIFLTLRLIVRHINNFIIKGVKWKYIY